MQFLCLDRGCYGLERSEDYGLERWSGSGYTGRRAGTGIRVDCKSNWLELVVVQVQAG